MTSQAGIVKNESDDLYILILLVPVYVLLILVNMVSNCSSYDFKMNY